MSVSWPCAGVLSMRTANRLWPASGSLKPKLAALKVCWLSSASVTTASVPAGGVLGPTFTVRVAVALPPWPSFTV